MRAQPEVIQPLCNRTFLARGICQTRRHDTLRDGRPGPMRMFPGTTIRTPLDDKVQQKRTPLSKLLHSDIQRRTGRGRRPTRTLSPHSATCKCQVAWRRRTPKTRSSKHCAKRLKVIFSLRGRQKDDVAGPWCRDGRTTRLSLSSGMGQSRTVSNKCAMHTMRPLSQLDLPSILHQDDSAVPRNARRARSSLRHNHNPSKRARAENPGPHPPSTGEDSPRVPLRRHVRRPPTPNRRPSRGAHACTRAPMHKEICECTSARVCANARAHACTHVRANACPTQVRVFAHMNKSTLT